MKTTIRTILAMMACSMALIACNKEAEIEKGGLRNGNADGELVEMVFCATQENDGTKAVIDASDSKRIDWQGADHISVFDGVSNNEFTLISGEGTTIAEFTGAAVAASGYTALYPYQSGATLTSEGVAGVVLPAEQKATPGSFDPAAAIMIGTSAKSDMQFAFKNCVAYIKVTTDTPAQKIKFTSYYNEPIAGTLTISYNAGVPISTVTANESNSVTLVPQGGETFEAGTYYLAVLPQAMQFGFVLTYTDAEGIDHNRVYNGEFASKRNVVTNMGALNTSNTYTNRQIVYYAPSKFENFSSIARVQLVGETRYVALNSTSKYTHEFSNGIGVLTFEKDIALIYDVFDSEDVNNITKVIFPETVYNDFCSFTQTQITELYYPNSVNSITIATIPSLTRLVIPNGSITADDCSISELPSLQEIFADGANPEHDALIIDGTLVAYAAGKYPSTYAIPDGVKKIGKECFKFSNAEHVIIPNTVQCIGERAFNYSQSLQSIVIPSSVTTLEKSCFSSTYNLSSVVFDEGSRITALPDYVFSYSKAIVQIPESVTSIGKYAFSNYNKYNTTKADIVIPDNVTSISEYAFNSAANIESITFGRSVETIGRYSFGSIYSRATTLGPKDPIDASQQTNLKYIYSKNPVPPVLDQYAIPSSTIKSDFVAVYVPEGSVEAYRNADVWRDFGDKILGYYPSTVADLSTTETANCYIIPGEGDYMFKAVKGNSSSSVGSMATAEVIWESYGTSSAITAGALISAVACSNGYISFSATSAKGNAVIAAKDESGNILWSWHIWLTDTPADQVYYNGAGTMMDRNLGATSATPGDVRALGLYYQWGRKDPFPGPDDIKSTTYARSTASFENVQTDATYGTIDYSVKNPTTFIGNGVNNHGDWHFTEDNGLWSESKTMYDPCPTGYRVPSKAVWERAKTGDHAYDEETGGINFAGVYGSSASIWYPALGVKSRSNYSITNPGQNLYYWTTTVNGTGDGRRSYVLKAEQGTTYVYNQERRSWGMSVRCQKIQ